MTPQCKQINRQDKAFPFNFFFFAAVLASRLFAPSNRSSTWVIQSTAHVIVFKDLNFLGILVYVINPDFLKNELQTGGEHVKVPGSNIRC